MTISVATLVGAVIGGMVLPARLDWLRRQGVSATALIVCWLLSIVGVLFAAVVGVVLLLLPDHGIPTTLLVTVENCLSALRHGMPPRLEELSGLVGLVVALFGVLRFCIAGRRLASRRAKANHDRLELLRPVAHAEPGSPPVLWLAHDRPLAFALPGRPGYVVATEGLNRHLTPEQVGAVFAHEEAHLRGRHDQVLAFVDVVAIAMPAVPLFRSAPESLRQLVEFAADSAAVRRYGAATVRAALAKVGQDLGPGTKLEFGRCAIEARLHHLARHNRRSRVRRIGASCLASTLPAWPLLAGGAIYVSSSVLFCAAF